MTSLPLNIVPEDEWINPNAPPHTTDLAEGLEWLEQGLPQEEIDAIRAQVEQRINEADHTEQNYFMRLDTKSLIKTEQEYLRCLHGNVPLKIIPYSHALELLRLESASKKKRDKAKQKRKVSKKARKRNR